MKDLTNTHINANYRKGIQTYVGSLWLYEDVFEYKANAVNSIISLGKIPYSDIESIDTVNTLGIIPNGMLVKLKNGKELSFVVINRNDVIAFLKAKKDC